MKTLYESILTNTKDRVGDVKRMMNAFGNKYVFVGFGIHHTGLDFLKQGRLDINKLDRLTNGMKYIHLDETKDMGWLNSGLENPYNDEARELVPYFKIMKQLLMFIENSQLPENESWMVGYRKDWNGFTNFLEDIFKPLTKQNIEIEILNKHSDIFYISFSSKVDGYNKPMDLFYIRVQRPNVVESILSNTKSRIKDTKTTLSTLGHRFRFMDMRIYDYIDEYISDRINPIQLEKQTKGKKIISKQIQRALDLYEKWNVTKSVHPHKIDRFKLIQQFFIWLDNLRLDNVETHKDLVQEVNSKLYDLNIIADGHIFISLRSESNNGVGYYSLYFGERLEVAIFTLDLKNNL